MDKYNDIVTMYHSARGGTEMDNAASSFLWETLAADYNGRTIMANLGVVCSTSFAAFANDPANLLMIALYEDKVVTFGWGNSIRAKTIHGHFITLRCAYGGVNRLSCEKIVQELLDVRVSGLEGHEDTGDSYLFNCLIAMIPVTNSLACRFTRNAGFIDVGVVPQSDIDPFTGESVDCILMHCTRDVLNKIDRYRNRQLFNRNRK
jgi:hypothetical protein